MSQRKKIQIVIYLGVSDGQEMEYDIALIDTDNLEGFKRFGLETAQKNYFVTSFDNYSLKKFFSFLPIHDNYSFDLYSFFN